jgi:hypothetical protein
MNKKARGPERMAGVGQACGKIASFFLDFFASFLCQDKNEEPLRLEQIIINIK